MSTPSADGPPKEAIVPSEAPNFWADRAWWRSTGAFAANAWLGTALVVASTIVAARRLGPHEFGIVVLALSITTLAATAVDVTFEEGLVHHGFKLIDASDWGGLRALLRTSVLLDLVIGVAVWGLLMGIAPPLARMLGADGVGAVHIRLAATSLLMATVDGTTGAVMLMTGRTGLRGLNAVVRGSARLVFVLVIVARGTALEVLYAAVAAAAVTSAFQAFLAWHCARQAWPLRLGRGSGTAWIRRLLPFGVYSSVTSTLLGAKTAIVPILIGHGAGSSAAGMFAVALFPVSLADIVNDPLRQSILPRQASLFARGDLGAVRRSVNVFTGLGLIVGGVAAVIGWFCQPWIIRGVYSSEFLPAISPARILLAAAVARLAVGWSKTYAAAIGRPGLRTAVVAGDLLLTCGLLVSMRNVSVSGAALVVSLTSAILAGTWWLIATRSRFVDRIEPDEERVR